MFNPYKKLAKLSLKRAKLSCISCKSIMFPSSVAIESDSSANWGSSVSRGGRSLFVCAGWLREERKEEREEGRRGVVGRERDREGLVAEEDISFWGWRLDLVV